QNIQTKGLNCKILQNKDLSAREHLKTSLGQLRGPAWFGERTHSCPNSILPVLSARLDFCVCDAHHGWFVMKEVKRLGGRSGNAFFVPCFELPQ
ncbi:MAG: hypothetical protein WAL58_06905, partial [Terriglobales bacterium]